MKIYIGTDHAGFELKESLKPHLEENGFEVEDLGAHTYNKEDDYPDIVRLVALRVSEDTQECRGIILGHSGQGEAIVANRIRGVRAAVYYGGPDEIITLAREHNNANVLSLGAGFITTEEARHAATLWLATAFSNEERHERRISKIDIEESPS